MSRPRWTLEDVEKIGLDRLVRRPAPAKKATAKQPQPDQREAEIQKGILDYLRAKKILCWKNRAVGIRKPNGSYIPVPITERGVSDIGGVLHGGRFLAVEVKRPGQQPTSQQLMFLERVNEQGGLGFVACSIDDCQKHGL